MFTGLVTDLGKVRGIRQPPAGGSSDARFTIDSGYDPASLEIGASISCSGACLTVVETHADGFSVDVSGETLSKTNLGAWRTGTWVNLERSLRMGDELGGHIVTGHVDGVARIADRESQGGSWRFTFEVPDSLAGYIAPKGSIALDGVSLTINDVRGSRFDVNIIPHTFEVTTFGQRQVDDVVNLEIDILARYVARQLEGAWPSRTA